VALPLTNVSQVAGYRLCHGCGACAYACEAGAIELRNFVDDGIRPVVEEARCQSCGVCVSVCSGIQLDHSPATWPAEVLNELSGSWGPVLEVWEGHSADEEIWFKSGSGGAATALALYALEQEGAGGVLQVGMDPERPYLNRTVVSRTPQELLACVGSRYAPAALCAGLGMIEQSHRPMVLVGKPCDIASASLARKSRPRLDRNISATISIFCGGTPSTRGTLELLKVLGVAPEDVADLRYRGHGWPGMTGVNLKTGRNRRVEIKYREAWDRVLTKHKPFRCQVCPDGTGEFADLACGDPWYRAIEEGERGSSLILVRTERGRRLLRRAMETGYLIAEARPADVLPQSQEGLLMRRRAVWPKAIWARLVGWPFPTFAGMSLLRNWCSLPVLLKWSSFHRAGRYLLGLRDGDCRRL
jgi:coenzyme F420 hydrogenase subunit beta